MKKTAAIIGATGLVGSHLLQLLLSSEEYERILVMGRSSTGVKDAKLEEYLGELTENTYWQWKQKVNDVYCCIGTTRSKTGDLAQYKQIDMGIPLHAAQWGVLNGMDSFAVVSAMGADPESRIFYNRIKGQMEEAVSKLIIPKLLIFRPSLILGKRDEFRMGEMAGKILIKTFSLFIPAKYKGIHAEVIARAMLRKTGELKNGMYIFESDQIREAGS